MLTLYCVIHFLQSQNVLEFERGGDPILCRYLSCSRCVEQKTCGWCASSQMCMEGSRSRPYEQNCTFWNFELCEAGCKEHADCSSCVEQDGCGFCESTCECLQGHSKGPAFGNVSCPSWKHRENAKSCALPRPREGHFPPGTSESTKTCAAKQFLRLRMRHLTLEAKRKSAIDFAKKMEEMDSDG